MKTLFYSYSSFIKSILLGLAVLGTVTLMSCNNDDPTKEDVPELITRATLTFTPSGGGATVTVTATDPDGEGVQDITVDGPITLAVTKTYTLSIRLINELADPADAEYDISKEVEEEGAEHMFFFSFTSGAFASPTGNGNIDTRNDALNYLDEDESGLPIGLLTSWTTGVVRSGDKFRVVLKHQPGTKTTTSEFSVGETDLDIEFTLNVQ